VLSKLQTKSPSEHDKVEQVMHFFIGAPVVLYDSEHGGQGIANGAYGTIVEILLDA
jgi:hypothetical protein